MKLSNTISDPIETFCGITGRGDNLASGRPGFYVAVLLLAVVCIVLPMFGHEALAQEPTVSEATGEQQTALSGSEESIGLHYQSNQFLVLGLRGGASIPTGKVLKNTSSGSNVGPLLNFEALYPLKEWIRLGVMIEYNMNDLTSYGGEIGRLAVYSILPTAEFRPTRRFMADRGIDWMIPYASLGAGINYHNFSDTAQSGNVDISFKDSFGLRIAAGFDVPLATGLFFNSELAWKKDTGTYRLNGVDGDYDASSFNMLIGIRAEF